MKNKMLIIKEIAPGLITPNPRNPRKSLEGKSLDELEASIREKGIIEPIIVRIEKGKGTSYEVVAGSRRLLAATRAGLEAIPAVIRDLSDEEALDIMIIENLQRQDLTESEEAESFKIYIGKHGEKGIKELAEKTGISAQYIRRRLAVLGLPVAVIKTWEKGQIRYGHLEQLLRVKDSPEFKRFCRQALEEDHWGNRTTVEELKRGIDNQSPSFKLAYFPITPEGCGSCHKNSMVQRDLFGIDDAKASRCLDPACFKKKQNDWLLGHWKESPPGKKYGTNGFRFEHNVSWNDHETVYKPDEKCKACPKFLTIIDDTGQASEYRGGRECFDKSCLRARERKARGEETSKRTQEREPGEPRVPWHGEYFRDVFLKKRLPEVVKTIEADGEKARTLLLTMIAHENSGVRDAIGKILGIKDAIWRSEVAIKKLLELPYEKVKSTILEALSTVILQGESRSSQGGYSDGFGIKNRNSVSKYLGIDLSEEWSMTEEYLKAKTKAEILAFEKKFKLFSDPKVRKYFADKLKRAALNFTGIKKSELVNAILKSGVELVGKVPEEILKEKR